MINKNKQSSDSSESFYESVLLCSSPNRGVKYSSALSPVPKPISHGPVNPTLFRDSTMVMKHNGVIDSDVESQDLSREFEEL